MIYLGHFGLREAPFGITPDTAFFYSCTGIQDALDTLVVAVANGEGFIKITGDVGTGKTLLCRKFLASLDENWVSAYIPNPVLDPRALLLALAEELGATPEEGLDQHHLIKSLNLTLLNLARQRKRVVVCLDETQAMPIESLEALRLLTNLETEKRKLLQVVLFGQPELNEHLRHHSIRQLRQRISFQYDLHGLNKDELERYLRHRLAVAGFAGETLFGKGAVGKLHRITEGTPRLVNIVAHKALMLAFSEGRQQVLPKHVRGAAADTPEVRRDWLPWAVLLTGAAVGASLAIAWMALR